MSDTISIYDLEVWTHLGVPDEERANEQKVLVSIWFRIDTKPAGQADDIALSVDYDAVCQSVHRIAAEKPRQTIEALNEDIATALLAEYEKMEDITISTQKHIIAGTQGIRVTIDRKR